MPVQHMVWLKFNDGITADRIAHHLHELESLRDLAPGIQQLCTGRNFTDRARGFSYGLLVTTDNRATLDVYLKHPRHVAVAIAIRADAEVMALDFEHQP